MQTPEESWRKDSVVPKGEQNQLQKVGRIQIQMGGKGLILNEILQLSQVVWDFAIPQIMTIVPVFNISS